MNYLYVLGGLGVIGVSGAGAYLINNTFFKTSETTLRSKLRGEKHLIMDSSNGNWSSVVEKYNNEKTTSDKKFSDLSGTVTDQALKEKCESALTSSDNSLYEKVKLWCIVPRNVQQRLEDLGISTLKTDGEDDKSKWNLLKDKYKDATENQKIKDFTIPTPEEAEAWKKLQAACKGYIAKDKWDAEYDYFLKKATVWCSSHE
ncbi:hypothetical protein MHC_04005 [Mycoplasma haemocanis str. Illinois]|uniref:Uncharacterized protein n=1 Tax=Mycoplasma haemocanis (strain Illinois) TaxID=1111676 RepID=H6N7N7_MYCHN|nr:hypothetical protein [Mycoplasma haemocanis]AEW45659.1 hypothetical protein MHC_04005 [Mycoplasma haemocanis str. Illinois]